MEIQVKVVACGPISNAELTLPERGIVAIIGPSLSGKSMLETALSSFALASTIASDGVLLGTLAERLRDENWEELFSSIDPMEYLTAVEEYKGSEDFLQRLDEVVKRATDKLGAREYLAKMAFIYDFCAAKEIDVWGGKAPAALKVELKIDRLSVSASLPAPDPRLVGLKALNELVLLEPASNIVGINVGRPTRFLRELYGKAKGESSTPPYPSVLLARVLLKSYHVQVDPDIYRMSKQILLESWKEISSYEITEDELTFFRTRQGPEVRVRNRVFPWDFTSEGFINLMAHLIIFEIVEILASEGKKIIVGIEEPEAHLDPYVAYKLPLLYSALSRKRDVVFLFTTHSEALVKGIEQAVRSENLKPDYVKIYETIGSKSEGEAVFTLKECPVAENGLIERSRFTKIAWRILKGEWEL
ncbi:MAG: hypothetical protein QXM08_03725 [Thermofilaceae archaeon]